MKISVRAAAPVAFTLLAVGAYGQNAPASKDDAFVPYKIDWDKGLIVAREKDGKIRWQVPVERLPLGKVQSIGPSWASDADRVYLRCEGGVAALDGKTGAVSWSVAEKCESVEVVGNLVFSGEGEFSREKPVLVARSTAEGKEVFRTELPFDSVLWSDAKIKNDDGRLIAQFSFGDKAAILSQTGKILHAFNSQILQTKKIGDMRVFFSGLELFAISPKDTEAWSLKFKFGMNFDVAGEWMDLPDKTVIVFIYGMISDSGVTVVRFDPATGKQLWEASCQPLGVGHLKYSHKATATVENQQIIVHSVGSYGEFTEVLDLMTGKQLSRK